MDRVAVERGKELLGIDARLGISGIIYIPKIILICNDGIDKKMLRTDVEHQGIGGIAAITGDKPLGIPTCMVVIAAIYRP